MKINSVRNLNFRGTWEMQSPKTVNTFVKDYCVNHVYTQKQIYHPFADEKVSPSIKAMEGIRAFEYLEYDSHDDNFGAEEKSVVIQQTKIGSRLDITEAQYNELKAVKQAGEKAAKKLSKLGEAKYQPMELPLTRGNNTRSCIEEMSKSNAKRLASEYGLIG